MRKPGPVTEKTSASFLNAMSSRRNLVCVSGYSIVLDMMLDKHPRFPLALQSSKRFDAKFQAISMFRCPK